MSEAQRSSARVERVPGAVGGATARTRTPFPPPCSPRMHQPPDVASAGVRSYCSWTQLSFRLFRDRRRYSWGPDAASGAHCCEVASEQSRRPRRCLHAQNSSAAHPPSFCLPLRIRLGAGAEQVQRAILIKDTETHSHTRTPIKTLMLAIEHSSLHTASSKVTFTAPPTRASPQTLPCKGTSVSRHACLTTPPAPPKRTTRPRTTRNPQDTTSSAEPQNLCEKPSEKDSRAVTTTRVKLKHTHTHNKQSNTPGEAQSCRDEEE